MPLSPSGLGVPPMSEFTRILSAIDEGGSTDGSADWECRAPAACARGAVTDDWSTDESAAD